MEFTLEQAFASMVRYVQGKAGSDDKLYLDELPEDFVVPSIYFPVPITESRQVTFDTWLTEIYVDIWFMGATDWAANSDAVQVRNALLRDRCVIDIISSSGEPTGRKFRVTEPRLQKKSENCVSVSLRVRNYVSWVEETQLITDLSFKGAFSSYFIPWYRIIILGQEQSEWIFLSRWFLEHTEMVLLQEKYRIQGLWDTGSCLMDFFLHHRFTAEEDETFDFIKAHIRIDVPMDDAVDLKMRYRMACTLWSSVMINGGHLLDGAVALDAPVYPEWSRMEYIVPFTAEEDETFFLYLPALAAELDGTMLLDGQIYLNSGREKL